MRKRPRTEPVRRLARTRVQRRDEFQPKVVTSNHDIEAWDTVFGKGSGLQPVRDTGIALQSRRDMRLAQKKKRFNVVLFVALGCFFVLLFAGIIWMQRSDARGRKLAEKSTATAAAKSTTSGSAKNTHSSAGRKVPASIASSSLTDGVGLTLTQEAKEESVTAAAPTPQVATYKKLKIHLPVSVKNMTEVAFHQASYSYALPMKTHLPFYDLGKAKKQRGTKRDKSIQPVGPNALLCGSALKYWRSGRSTAAMTALDCGAAPGSLVYAPVSGTISRVCTYNYENKVDDYEIHIVPEGYPDIEVVLIHVKSPYVIAGDTVAAGVTPLARVRKMSAYVRNQLGTYAKEAGNHTHMQINDTKCAAYKQRQAHLKTVDETDSAKESAGIDTSAKTKKPNSQTP